MSLQLQARNIKCAGCVANIQNGLAELEGIESVDVEIESGTVTIEGSGLDRKTITNRLAELGYPVMQD